MTEKNIQKWWDANAKKFQRKYKIPLNISYGPWMPTEDKLKLMGNLNGKKVLEIGCGGAQCGITFAKKGANVIGIDISKEQLKYAQKLAEKNKVKIKLIQGNISNLSKIKSHSKDIVFSSWVLFYVGNLTKCFKEVFRVLKKGGQFVFSTSHPFWGIVDKKKMKINRNYFELGMYEENFHGKFVAYRQTLSDFTEALHKAGFIIERIL